jgi:hypothetical protein
MNKLKVGQVVEYKEEWLSSRPTKDCGTNNNRYTIKAVDGSGDGYLFHKDECYEGLRYGDFRWEVPSYRVNILKEPEDATTEEVLDEKQVYGRYKVAVGDMIVHEINGGVGYVVETDDEGYATLMEYVDKGFGCGRDASVPRDYVSVGVDEYWNVSWFDEYKVLERGAKPQPKQVHHPTEEEKGGLTTNNKQSIMTTVNNFAKKLLDKKTRTLINAGYMTRCIELTHEGKEAMWLILFEAHKEELVKMADEVIKEREEDK